MENSFNRRKFLQTSVLASAGIAVPIATTKAATMAKKTPLKSKINIDVMGSGFRGQGHIDLVLNP